MSVIKEENNEEQTNTEEFSGVKSDFPYHAAIFSVFAPIAAIIMNLIAKDSHPPVPYIIAIISMIIYPTALVLGIIALCFIKRYGRKGILVRSIIGIIINSAIIFLVISLIPAMRQARKNAIKMNRYQFISPPGFERNETLAQKMPDALDTYINGDINDSQSDIILIIEDVHEILNKDENVSYLIEGKNNIKVFKKKWKNHDINVFRIEENVGNVATLTYNAQIPVIPAVQIKLMGLEAHDPELKKILDIAIRGISGRSNWD